MNKDIKETTVRSIYVEEEFKGLNRYKHTTHYELQLRTSTVDGWSLCLVDYNSGMYSSINIEELEAIKWLQKFLNEKLPEIEERFNLIKDK